MKTIKGLGLWILRSGDFLCGCLRANGTHKMLGRWRRFEQESRDQHLLKSFPWCARGLKFSTVRLKGFGGWFPLQRFIHVKVVIEHITDFLWVKIWWFLIWRADGFDNLTGQGRGSCFWGAWVVGSVFWDVWSGRLRAMAHKICWGNQDGLSVASKSLVRFLLKRYYEWDVSC